MATTVITGRDLALTIATKTYDAQVTTVTLEADHVIETYQTLDGRAYKAIDDSWTLHLEMLADWGASGGAGTYSICELLWTAAETAPNTTLACSLTAATGAVFAFDVLPTFPSVGGSAPDAQTVSLSSQVVGTPTETFS